MNKLKIVKKKLKQQKLWKRYCKTFHHKQMRLVFSKICLIFNPQIKIKQLFEEEINLLNKTKNKNMFIESFDKINQLSNQKYDWVSFGKLMWYVFQTSTFYLDQKKQKFNIFNKNNYVKLNSIKRNYYYNWLDSILITEENFNDKLKKVLSKIF